MLKKTRQGITKEGSTFPLHLYFFTPPKKYLSYEGEACLLPLSPARGPSQRKQRRPEEPAPGEATAMAGLSSGQDLGDGEEQHLGSVLDSR